MGYTHYVDQHGEATEAQWRAIRRDVAALVLASPVGLADASGDRGTSPEITDGRIAFNGVGGEGYEDFVLERESAAGGGFCKTARNPYDLIVAAALVVAAHHAPDVYAVESDGHDFEWATPLAFVRGTLGEGYELPRGVAENAAFLPGYRKAGEPGYDRARAAYMRRAA